MKRLPFFGLLVVCLWAGDEDFNGRWNLTLNGDPRGRAWWLEVEGAGTPNLRGKFVGAPGGQVDVIPMMAIEGGELVWRFPEKNTGVYRAKLHGHSIFGSLDNKIKFTGRRAPILPDVDDGSWKKGAKVELFNGKDMTGWKCTVPGRGVEWRVEKGSMKNNEKAADITSLEKFFNFLLHVEFKVAQKSNSGIGLRARYEVQIYGDYGDPASMHGNGALYSRVLPKLNATRPPDQWQTFDITLIGRQLSVVLNGKKIHDKVTVEGLTAMATDPDEDKPGPITLQGDHGPVEFRKITVTPLTK